MMKIRDFLIRFTPEIIFTIYLALFFVVKNPNSPNDRVIMSDGKGYYGYITAIFIYHDLDYRFIEDYESKYYPNDPTIFKDFRYNFNGQTVNQYFPGMAFLMLPFFLIAHLLSWISGLPTDGYSIIYQYSIGFSALFYLWLGLHFLRKLLGEYSFAETTASIILFLIAFGTNINYYTLKEGTMTHVYNFALIGAFLFFIKKAADCFHKKWIIAASVLFGLIISVRPTNGMILLAVPFVAGSWRNFSNLFANTSRDYLILITVLLSGAIFPFFTMLLWYLQSGHWLVYTYGEFGFDFANPHFFSILFSFEKGWFLYTPLAFVALVGFIQLFRESRFQFCWLMGFFIVYVYVTSSWEVWAYTSNFGQRVFIDLYALIGLLLAFAGRLIIDKKMLSNGVLVLLLSLVGLNNLQFYQHYTYVFPPGKITWQKYKHAFWRLVPAPRSFFPDKSIVKKKEFYNDFEKDYGWLNYASVTDTLAYQGCCSSQTGKANEYSIGIWEPVDDFAKQPDSWVKVSAWIFSNQKYSDARLVIDFESDGKSIGYNPVFLNEFNRENRWVYLEFARRFPKNSGNENKLRVYFFNTNGRELFLVDNLKIEVLTLNENVEN
mgnify:CR=1 FL=1